eukprot:9822486-Heterocapsa_arctica.AAC.1
MIEREKDQTNKYNGIYHAQNKRTDTNHEEIDTQDPDFQKNNKAMVEKREEKKEVNRSLLNFLTKRKADETHKDTPQTNISKANKTTYQIPRGAGTICMFLSQ